MAESFNETLQGIQRNARNSQNGNPRYRIWGMSGSWFTEEDAQVNYLVPNYIGKPVRITLNDKGFVIQVSPIE